MVRLHDQGVILVPQRPADATTGRKRVDWALEPAEHPVAVEVQQAAAGGGEHEGEGVETWRAFLPPRLRVEDEDVAIDTVLKTWCRFAWQGDEYVIDQITRKGARGRLRFLVAVLKRANPRPTP